MFKSYNFSTTGTNWTPLRREYNGYMDTSEEAVQEDRAVGQPFASEKCYRDQIRKREIWGIKAGFHGKM
jgi:hypothetical protein